MVIPGHGGAVEDRTADAGTHVSDLAVVVLHRHHAAVAAAEPAAHGALHRDLARLAVAGRQPGHRGQHRLGAAGVDGGLRRPGELLQRGLERHGDPAPAADAAVFGGEHEVDAEAVEELQVVELVAGARAVEERGRHLEGDQGLGQRGERGQADAAGDHPRRAAHRRIEGEAERTQARHLVAGFEVVEPAGGASRPLVEHADRPHRPEIVAQHLEHRERPPQHRIGAAGGLEHHELARLGERTDLRRFERQHVVVARQPDVGDHRRAHVDRRHRG